jgi:hypothetical protein
LDPLTGTNEPEAIYTKAKDVIAAVTCFDKTDDVSEWPATQDKGFHLLLSADSSGVSVDSFDWVRALNNEGKFRSDPTVNMVVGSMTLEQSSYEFFGASTNDWEAPGLFKLTIVPDDTTYVLNRGLD